MGKHVEALARSQATLPEGVSIIAEREGRFVLSRWEGANAAKLTGYSGRDGQDLSKYREITLVAAPQLNKANKRVVIVQMHITADQGKGNPLWSVYVMPNTMKDCSVLEEGEGERGLKIVRSADTRARRTGPDKTFIEKINPFYESPGKVRRPFANSLVEPIHQLHRSPQEQLQDLRDYGVEENVVKAFERFVEIVQDKKILRASHARQEQLLKPVTDLLNRGLGRARAA